MLEPEHDLAGTGQAVFGRLQLLYLYDQLALPRGTELRAFFSILRIGKSRSRTGARLDDDLARERMHAGGRDGDATLAIFYFPRYADTHSWISRGPRYTSPV